jgi:predicted transglutaminase-like cysteine proteinase
MIFSFLVAALTRQVDTDLESRINQYVNQVVQYDRTESWRPNYKRGDCKTMSVDKMILLREKGITPSRMAIWSVIDEAGEGHAVLVVDNHTVLDSRFTWPEEKSVLEKIGYSFKYPLSLDLKGDYP